MNPRRLLCTTAFLFLLAAVTTGCGSGSEKLATVAGKVTVDGAPVTAGQVSYIPLAENKTKTGMSAGTISSSGEYKIFTSGKEGAPIGKYKVIVTPSMVPSGSGGMPATPFNNAYSREDTTTLSMEVMASAPPGHYDLKLTK